MQIKENNSDDLKKVKNRNFILFFLLIRLIGIVSIIWILKPFSTDPVVVYWDKVLFSLLSCGIYSNYSSIHFQTSLYNSIGYKHPSKISIGFFNTAFVTAVTVMAKYFYGFNNPYSISILILSIPQYFVLRMLQSEIRQVAKNPDLSMAFKLKDWETTDAELFKEKNKKFGWEDGYLRDNIYIALMYIKYKKQQKYKFIAHIVRVNYYIGALFVIALFAALDYGNYYFGVSKWIAYLVTALIWAQQSPSMRLIGNLYKFANSLSQRSKPVDDNRPPVLLLRSFRLDRIRITPPDTPDSSIMLSEKSFLKWGHVTFEEAVRDILNTIGPVKAIGRPTEVAPPPGAQRIYVPDESWQVKVTDLMKSSAAVVIIPDISQGVEWELLNAPKYIDISKIIILFPPLNEYWGEVVENYIENWNILTERVDYLGSIKAGIDCNTVAIFFSDGQPEIISSKASYAHDRLREFEERLMHGNWCTQSKPVINRADSPVTKQGSSDITISRNTTPDTQKDFPTDNKAMDIRPALIAAAQVGVVGIVKVLLEEGAEVNAKTNDGDTALMTAALEGHTDVAILLTDKGADVNAKKSDGWTVLMAAVLGERVGIVRALINKGADVNAKTNEDGTALMAAAQLGNVDITLALLEKGANTNAKATNGATPLIQATQEGNIEVAKILLANGADMNAQRIDGSSALMMSVQNGHTAIVQLLLDAGADVDATRPDDGVTALMLAANLFPDIVRLLLNKGADVNKARTNDGITALMTASQYGQTDSVRIMIEKSADVNARSADGNTALIFAAPKGHREIIELLIAMGADVNIKRSDGFTALMFTAQEGHADIVKILLAKGAEANAIRSLDNGTALMLAASQGHANAVACLLKNGADVNLLTKDGVSALIPACELGHTDVVKLLLDNGANLKAQRKSDGVTALIISANKGHADIAKLLIEKGADVNEKSHRGTTPLMTASSEGHKEVAKLLRKAGAMA
jgi:ankyrin repeat protein